MEVQRRGDNFIQKQAEEIIQWLPQRYREILSRCPQNPKYHREGSVMNHTRLVTEVCLEYLQAANLSQTAARILKWACLLHDIGKPSVTRYEQGRWTARGHEAAGVSIARHILLSHAPELSTFEKQTICQLVKWHYAPFRWMKANRPFNLMESLHSSCDIRLLGVFAQIDFKGRICEDWIENQDLLSAFNTKVVHHVEQKLGNFHDFQDDFQKATVVQKNYMNYLLDQRSLQRPDTIPKSAFNTEKNVGKTVYLPIATNFSNILHGLDQHIGTERLFNPTSKHNLSEIELLHFKRWCELNPAYILGLNFPLWHRPTAKFLTRMLAESGFTVVHLFWDESWETLLSRNPQLQDTQLRQQAWVEHLSMQYFHPWLAHETVFVSYNT
ncbi:MAG: HD domain-containing protein [Bacteroidia bacterium]|nr:HD domain-containing protein [Bacteroidia bacterium]